MPPGGENAESVLARNVEGCDLQGAKVLGCPAHRPPRPLQGAAQAAAGLRGREDGQHLVRNLLESWLPRHSSHGCSCVLGRQVTNHMDFNLLSTWLVM